MWCDSRPDVDKSEGVITEMMRSLMSQFALAMDTKTFRNDVLKLDDSQVVLVHEHLYETTANLAENQNGGIWHPDELSRFFKKIRQYQDLLLRNSDIFFSRVQIWGKSVTESRAKFYAMRDLYEREKKADNRELRSEAEQMRFSVLQDLFHNVLPTTRDKDTSSFVKIPNLWSPDDLDVLLQFLVKITLDIQEKGSSDLVNVVATKLNRTEQSLVGKLFDMRRIYLRKSTYPRAARTLCLLDAQISSLCTDFVLSHKIFEAGNSILAQRLKDRKQRGQVQLVGTKRKKKRAAPYSHRKTSSDTKNKAAATSCESSHAVVKPEVVYTDFVREAAEKYKWSEGVTHSVCVGMNRFMDLYRSRKLKAFFEAVVQSTEVTSKFAMLRLIGVKLTETVFNGQALLKLFEQRHGSLDAFEEIALGVSAGTKSAPSSQNADLAAKYQNQGPTMPSPEEAITQTGEEEPTGATTDDQTASPFDLTASPLSVSDPENDSSLEDENDPIDVDADGDDELESLSPEDSNDNDASLASSFKASKPYPKLYGKSDKVMKPACKSCAKKETYRTHSYDSDGDETKEEGNDEEVHQACQDNSPWSSLISILDKRIVELEVRNRDLIEWKEERERRQQKVKWRSDIRIEVLSLMQDASD
ncbi:hypothetical protein FI667_g1167, partial [Globisporangium splendens]